MSNNEPLLSMRLPTGINSIEETPVTLTITMRRHNYIWHVWEMSETHDDGRTYLIAQGQHKRKRKARAQATAWHNLYLRQLGLYQSDTGDLTYR